MTSTVYKNGKICIHTVSSKAERFEGIRTWIFNFSKFFSSSFIQDGIRKCSRSRSKHEAQEELKIDLEDLEEFIIDEEESESESESDYGIADSYYESDSDNDIVSAEITSHSITRAKINTFDGTNRMRNI